MYKVKVDELLVNAIGQALDERSARLATALGQHICEPPTPSRDFAIDSIRDAIRDTTRARIAIIQAVEEDEPEPPSDMTFDEYFAGDHFVYERKEEATAELWHDVMAPF